MSPINLKEATIRLNALAPAQNQPTSIQPELTGNGEQITQTEKAKKSKTKSVDTPG